jgi:hypothetical protein
MVWMIGVLVFDSRRGLGIFLFTTASRTALRTTQPPIQRVLGALSLGVKRPGREADHSPPSVEEVKELSRTIPPLPQYVFMAWCSVKEQGQLYLFTFYLYLSLGNQLSYWQFYYYFCISGNGSNRTPYLLNARVGPGPYSCLVVSILTGIQKVPRTVPVTVTDIKRNDKNCQSNDNLSPEVRKNKDKLWKGLAYKIHLKQWTDVILI